MAANTELYSSAGDSWASIELPAWTSSHGQVTVEDPSVWLLRRNWEYASLFGTTYYVKSGKTFPKLESESPIFRPKLHAVPYGNICFRKSAETLYNNLQLGNRKCKTTATVKKKVMINIYISASS